MPSGYCSCPVGPFYGTANRVANHLQYKFIRSKTFVGTADVNLILSRQQSQSQLSITTAMPTTNTLEDYNILNY